MTEIEVDEAFVRGGRAEISNLTSDGKRLCTGETVVAEWEGEEIRIAPENGDPAGPMRQEILATLVRLQIHKEKILRFLIRLGSEEALRLQQHTSCVGSAERKPPVRALALT